MNEQRKCLVGHDDDYGWAIGLAIALFVIAMIVIWMLVMRSAVTS